MNYISIVYYLDYDDNVTMYPQPFYIYEAYDKTISLSLSLTIYIYVYIYIHMYKIVCIYNSIFS